MIKIQSKPSDYKHKGYFSDIPELGVYNINCCCKSKKDDDQNDVFGGHKKLPWVVVA